MTIDYALRDLDVCIHIQTHIIIHAVRQGELAQMVERSLSM